mgnify:CR=1 FL=1
MTCAASSVGVQLSGAGTPTFEVRLFRPCMNSMENDIPWVRCVVKAKALGERFPLIEIRSRAHRCGKVFARKNDFGREPRRNPKNRTRKWIFEGNLVVNKPPHTPGADWTHIQRSLAVDPCVEPFFDCSARPPKKRDLPNLGPTKKVMGERKMHKRKRETS